MGSGLAVGADGCLGSDGLDFKVGGGCLAAAAGGRGLGDKAVVNFGVVASESMTDLS